MFFCSDTVSYIRYLSVNSLMLIVRIHLYDMFLPQFNAFGSTGSAHILHESLTTSILRAPMSFFHSTSPGRVLHLFARDMATIDRYCHPSMLSLSHTILHCCSCRCSILFSLLFSLFSSRNNICRQTFIITEYVVMPMSYQVVGVILMIKYVPWIVLIFSAKIVCFFKVIICLCLPYFRC